jgi:hypothetical protein
MGDFCEFDARAGRMFEELLRRTHLSTADELAAIVAEEARAVGVESLVVYLIDYEPRLLVPVPAPDASGRQPLPVLGTMAGRAFASSSILELEREAIIEQRAGALRDDATAVLLEWRRGTQRVLVPETVDREAG